jgi:hypothetical protein
MEKKEPNEGEVPCLVCMEPQTYLNTQHLSSSYCTSGKPDDVDQYREWVAKEHDIDRDDPIFETNQIQKPQNYRKHAKRLGLPLL